MTLLEFVQYLKENPDASFCEVVRHGGEIDELDHLRFCGDGRVEITTMDGGVFGFTFNRIRSFAIDA